MRTFYDLMEIQLMTLGRVPVHQENDAKQLIKVLAAQRELIAECYDFPYDNRDIENMETMNHVRYSQDRTPGRWWFVEEL